MTKTVTVVNNKIVTTETQPDKVSETSLDILLKRKAEVISRKNEIATMLQKNDNDSQKTIDEIDAEITEAYANGAMTDADYQASLIV